MLIAYTCNFPQSTTQMLILPLATVSAKDFEHTPFQGHTETPVLDLRI